VPELIWKGKYRDGVRAEPRRPALPFVTDEIYGPRSAPWHDRLILGDAADVLPSLLPDLAGRVALVYIDPPFDTGGSFDFRATIPEAPRGAPRIRLPAYRDARGLDAWLAWFHAAAALLRELLSEGGSLYVHLDAHAAHYAKVVLDEVFGERAFQREVVWRIGWVSGFKSRTRGWVRNHDTLLFYAKGGQVRTFNKEYIPYPPGYTRRDGAPAKASGYPIDDVWNGSDIDRLDSIQIVSFSGEKVGYPTQKNESLLSRIMRASSNPGDIVLDACAGSGTTAVVAQRLGRRWVACDQAPIAVHTTRKRLLVAQEVAPFVVQRVGRLARRPARKLSAQVRVDGRHATIELGSFALPAREVPRDAQAGVTHWSQWIEGWSVDWDHRGGPLHAGSRGWRTARHARLPLSVSHAYEEPGKYRALVRAFDVLGGATTRELRLEVDS
jgi:16S rRNA G966 N2-methylase RsmD